MKTMPSGAAGGAAWAEGRGAAAGVEHPAMHTASRMTVHGGVGFTPRAGIDTA